MTKQLPEIQIGNRSIGINHPPFLVAEISANHHQSLERALQIVKAAHAAGADAIKLQTYTPDTMTLDINEGDFVISDLNSLWAGKSLYQLYKEAYTPWEWHEPIFRLCKKLNIIGFSTPFDDTSVDFLEELDVPCYKIASLEMTDLPLITKVAATGKPLIISTGTATLKEIHQTVATAKAAGCKQLMLLKCTSAYPAPVESMHLRTISDLYQQFNLPIGLSDHTLGIATALASIPLGASLIEKHLTLSRSDPTLDAAFSLEPAEFSLLVAEAKRAWQALGKIHYGPTESEKGSYQLRRSLYFVQDIKKGERIAANQIRAIRPGFGLPPGQYAAVLGKTVVRDVKRGEPVRWEALQ